MTHRQRIVRATAAVAAILTVTSAVALVTGTTGSEARAVSPQGSSKPLPGWEKDWFRIMSSRSISGRPLDVPKHELTISTSDLSLWAEPRKMNSGQIAEIEAARKAGGAAGQTRQSKDGKPPTLWKGEKLVETSEPILFAVGSAEVTPHMAEVIKNAVKGLPSRSFLRYYGFSDFKGDEIDNQNLAMTRAKNVQKVVESVRGDLSHMSGYTQTELGDNFAPDAQISREERAKYLRRVDIRISPKL